jgi:MSHA biogenesis protein MshP
MCRKSGFRTRDSGSRGSQRGFSLVTAIFLLVVLAGLGAAMVTLSTSQQQTLAQDVQGARAIQAARAGIEWGGYQVLKVANACPASPTTLSFAGTALAGFTTQVTCSATTHTEGATTRSVYELTATARYGAVHGIDYVERVLTARVAR